MQIVRVQDGTNVAQAMPRDGRDFGFGAFTNGKARHCSATQVIEGDADNAGTFD